MHIKIKNKILSYGNYKVKCAIGKRGINVKKKEGDLITPVGIFKIRIILYRKDKIRNLRTKIKTKLIKKNMGWCDDPSSNKYNKLVKYPFKYKAEKLYRPDNLYDIIFVLNYNMSPIKKNKGSAIFIHVAKNNFAPTQGCIAIKKLSLKKLAEKMNKKTKVEIIKS